MVRLETAIRPGPCARCRAPARDHTLGHARSSGWPRCTATAALVEEADGGLTLTYAQAAKRVDRWAGGIAAQVEPGDRVVIATPNGYEHAPAVPGRVPGRCHPRAGQRADAAGRGRPRRRRLAAALVVRSAAEVDGAEPLADAAPGRARRRGRALLHVGHHRQAEGRRAHPPRRSSARSATAARCRRTGCVRDEAVVVAARSPTSWASPSLLGLACAGIPVYFLPRFRPDEVLDAIEPRRATIFVGVPAMYRMLLEAGAEERDLTSVRVWGSGADAMPADLAARFKKLGATAHAAVVGPVGEAAVRRGLRHGRGRRRRGGQGLAADARASASASRSACRCPATGSGSSTTTATRCARGEVGELWCGPRRDSRATGATPRPPAATLTDDGWLRTGDLARRGPLGTVLFDGRKKDVIKHGGYSVYALEVEQALEEHPDVLEAAVVGLPDERKGEVPAAVVRLRRRRDARRATRSGVGAGAPGRLQGARALRRRRRAAPHRHQQGPEARAPRSSSPDRRGRRRRQDVVVDGRRRRSASGGAGRRSRSPSFVDRHLVAARARCRRPGSASCRCRSVNVAACSASHCSAQSPTAGVEREPARVAGRRRGAARQIGRLAGRQVGEQQRASGRRRSRPPRVCGRPGVERRSTCRRSMLCPVPTLMAEQHDRRSATMPTTTPDDADDRRPRRGSDRGDRHPPSDRPPCSAPIESSWPSPASTGTTGASR